MSYSPLFAVAAGWSRSSYWGCHPLLRHVSGARLRPSLPLYGSVNVNFFSGSALSFDAKDDDQNPPSNPTPTKHAASPAELSDFLIELMGDSPSIQQMAQSEEFQQHAQDSVSFLSKGRKFRPQPRQHVSKFTDFDDEASDVSDDDDQDDIDDIDHENDEVDHDDGEFEAQGDAKPSSTELDSNAKLLDSIRFRSFLAAGSKSRRALFKIGAQQSAENPELELAYSMLSKKAKKGLKGLLNKEDLARMVIPEVSSLPLEDQEPHSISHEPDEEEADLDEPDQLLLTRDRRRLARKPDRSHSVFSRSNSADPSSVDIPDVDDGHLSDEDLEPAGPVIRDMGIIEAELDEFKEELGQQAGRAAMASERGSEPLYGKLNVEEVYQNRYSRLLEEQERTPLQNLKYFHLYPKTVKRWVEDLKTPPGSFDEETGQWEPLELGEDAEYVNYWRSVLPEIAQEREQVLVKKGKLIKGLTVVAPEDTQGFYRFGVQPDEIEAVNLHPKLRRVFSFTHASQPEINQFRKTRAIQKWGYKPNDTGSTAVQIAVLTEKINYLSDHLSRHPKDKHSAYGFQTIRNRRRALMKYLKSRNTQRYYEVVRELNLRDV